jgi:hypothetical protein
MINSVRNTVMFLLNKDNRGYVSPSEFDYFAKQAQLEIFESYFTDYARSVAMQNMRKKGQNYGDTVQHIQNKIDKFYTDKILTYIDFDSSSVGEEQDYFELPEDLYKLINITYLGGFGSDTSMSGGRIIQPIAPHKFDMVVNSNLSKPTVFYPVYVRKGDNIYVRPLSIQGNPGVKNDSPVIANYIRKPADPHWGYVTISSDPIYNSDSSIDFEISEEDETQLVIKICKYAGLSIREADVVQVTSQEEQLQYTKENS